MDEIQKRAQEVITLLEKQYPHPHTVLTFTTPFELLVAVMLSAQCTDARVNMVTPGLFAKYKSVQDFANASASELDHAIQKINFHANKAKNIQATAKIIVDMFHGEVPKTMEKLITLPGVARKTANVVLYNAFGINEGIAVDTHVIRVAGRLGLTKNTDPKKIEPDLMEIIPKSKWGDITHLLIFHGRNTCTARKPDCKGCVLNHICPSAFTF